MPKKIVAIEDIEIGYKRKIPIIAEIGVNHLGDINRAKKMVDLANEKVVLTFIKISNLCC